MKIETMSVLCNLEHSVGPSHIMQGSWTNTLSSLSRAMGSPQNLPRGIFPPILLGFRKVIMACYESLGFTLLWNVEWLESRLNADEHPPG